MAFLQSGFGVFLPPFGGAETPQKFFFPRPGVGVREWGYNRIAHTFRLRRGRAKRERRTIRLFLSSHFRGQVHTISTNNLIIV